MRIVAARPQSNKSFSVPATTSVLVPNRCGFGPGPPPLPRRITRRLDASGPAGEAAGWRAITGAATPKPATTATTSTIRIVSLHDVTQFASVRQRAARHRIEQTRLELHPGV